MKSHGIWVVAVAMVLAMAASCAWAADGPAAAPAARGAAAAVTDTAPPPVREESIYIPYAKLREVFEKEGRGVFLPYDKFMDLWKAARDKTATPAEAKPPVDSLITEVEAKAAVSKDVVTVTATLKIEILKEGWNEVPLRLSDVALTKATLDGEPARILFDAAAGGHKLLVEKKGKDPKSYSLVLVFAKAYTKAPGQNTVSFESPAAPVSRWEVHIPESGVKVNVHPLLAATEIPPAAKPAVGAAAPAAEETVVLAFVGAAPTVRLDWTPKAEGAKGLEALASVRVQQRTDVEEGVTRTRAILSYEISRAELGRLEIEVPADQKVVNVFDPNVREWSVATTTTGDVQKVSVQLFEPAKATQGLTVELEKFASDAVMDVRVPAIKALGVGRQQGFVVVRVAEGLRAEAAERSGLAQVDESELPGDLRSKWDFAYRYAAVPYVLALKVEKVQPRITADSLVEAHLATDKLTMNLTAVYTIERAGVFRLEVDVPEGFDVRSVRGATVPGVAPAQVDSHHLEGEKKTHVVVSLSRKAIGKVALEVQLERALHEPDLLTPTGKTAAIALVIPRVTPASVERESGRLVVYAPESLVVNPTKSDGLRSVTFQEAVDLVSGQRAAQTPVERAVLSFAYTQEPVTVALSAERRKPYVTARQLLVARLDSGVVKYESTLFYEVQYSGVKTLRLDVPKDLAGDLRITTTGIRHQPLEDQASLKDLAPGYEAWSLAGETEFMGHVTVNLAWEHKEKFDVGQKVTLAIPRLSPRGTDRAWGQIVLVKAETIDVPGIGRARQGLGPARHRSAAGPDERRVGARRGPGLRVPAGRLGPGGRRHDVQTRGRQAHEHLAGPRPHGGHAGRPDARPGPVPGPQRPPAAAGAAAGGRQFRRRLPAPQRPARLAGERRPGEEHVLRAAGRHPGQCAVPPGTPLRRQGRGDETGMPVLPRGAAGRSAGVPVGVPARGVGLPGLQRHVDGRVPLGPDGRGLPAAWPTTPMRTGSRGSATGVRPRPTRTRTSRRRAGT